MTKRPAKKGLKVNRNIVGAIGAAVLGAVAGATTIFLSKKENRDMVKKTIDTTVKKGSVEIERAKKKIVATKKKLLKRK